MDRERVPELSIVCNCLFPMVHVSNSNTNALIRSVVGGVGNWVGGTLRCYDDEMIFSINRLNAAFQKETAPLFMPYGHVDNVGPGRMMWFFSTVDIHMNNGLVRFRASREKNLQLEAFLRTKLSNRLSMSPHPE